MRTIKKDSTNQSVIIRIIDSTSGVPEQAVEHNTSGIDLWYRREGATRTAITEAALAALDTAHSDGGIEHIGDGYYRLDLPDAAVATGANGVMVGGAVTDMIVIGCYVHLVDYDPQDTVRLGLTALPNAAADAAGGLPISDAGELDLDTQIGTDIDAILADTDEIQGDLANAGRLDTIFDAILADTGELQADWVNAGRLDTILDSILADTNELQADDTPGALTTIDGKLDTIDNFLDTEIAAILADTNEMQADLTNGGRLDLIFDAILADTGELQTDWANGGRLDLIIDAIVADTNELQADDVPGLIAALNNITAASVMSATEDVTGDTLALKTMVARIYMRLFHEVNVLDADGSAEIRNSGDSGNVATGSITDAAGTTSQAKWSWA